MVIVLLRKKEKKGGESESVMGLEEESRVHSAGPDDSQAGCGCSPWSDNFCSHNIPKSYAGNISFAIRYRAVFLTVNEQTSRQ